MWQFLFFPFCQSETPRVTCIVCTLKWKCEIRLPSPTTRSALLLQLPKWVANIAPNEIRSVLTPPNLLRKPRQSPLPSQHISSLPCSSSGWTNVVAACEQFRLNLANTLLLPPTKKSMKYLSSFYYKPLHGSFPIIMTFWLTNVHIIARESGEWKSLYTWANPI